MHGASAQRASRGGRAGNGKTLSPQSWQILGSRWSQPGRGHAVGVGVITARSGDPRLLTPPGVQLLPETPSLVGFLPLGGSQLTNGLFPRAPREVVRCPWAVAVEGRPPCAGACAGWQPVGIRGPAARPKFACRGLLQFSPASSRLPGLVRPPGRCADYHTPARSGFRGEGQPHRSMPRPRWHSGAQPHPRQPLHRSGSQRAPGLGAAVSPCHARCRRPNGRARSAPMLHRPPECIRHGSRRGAAGPPPLLHDARRPPSVSACRRGTHISNHATPAPPHAAAMPNASVLRPAPISVPT